MMISNDENDTYSMVSSALDSLLEIPFHVYLKDRHGCYIKCNRAQAISFGLNSPSDVVGRSDADFHIQKEYQIIKHNDQDVQKHHKPIITIEQCTFFKSEPQAMLSLKMPVYLEKQQALGVFGVSFPSIYKNDFRLLSLVNDQASMLAKNFLNHDVQLPPKKTRISKREKECLDYLINGLTAKEIARQLSLSPRTIEFYIENMKKRFGCCNRTELIAKTYALGLHAAIAK